MAQQMYGPGPVSCACVWNRLSHMERRSDPADGEIIERLTRSDQLAPGNTESGLCQQRAAVSCLLMKRGRAGADGLERPRRELQRESKQRAGSWREPCPLRLLALARAEADVMVEAGPFS